MLPLSVLPLKTPANWVDVTLLPLAKLRKGDTCSVSSMAHPVTRQGCDDSPPACISYPERTADAAIAIAIPIVMGTIASDFPEEAVPMEGKRDSASVCCDRKTLAIAMVFCDGIPRTSLFLMECFRGRHRGGGVILLHFCGSLRPFLMQQK